jgi:transposase-like protein
MSVKLAHSVVPIMEICPNCKGAMTITEIAPILFADELEDVTYRCKACRSEMKRTFKRRSGAWQLVPEHMRWIETDANTSPKTGIGAM